MGSRHENLIDPIGHAPTQYIRRLGEAYKRRSRRTLRKTARKLRSVPRAQKTIAIVVVVVVEERTNVGTPDRGAGLSYLTPRPLIATPRVSLHDFSPYPAFYLTTHNSTAFRGASLCSRGAHSLFIRG